MARSPAERFVVEKYDPIGFGWCTAVRNGLATVRYFDLPDSVAEERQVPLGDVEARDLPQDMRVWIRNKGFGWWPGRIRGRERNGPYFVQLAGVGPAVRVPAWSIQVRWDRPLASATDALAIGMTDSPEYYEARFSVMSNLVSQRVACRGFASLLSASVRPFHHQIDVLTRVLNDPVMRFVLADEVGLGKTIEAGLIIRQLFLDRPTSQVVVSTPRTLVGQWSDELADKLRLRPQLRSGRLRVIDHDQLHELTANPSDLLVVDEAHQLLERVSERSSEMELLCKVAQATPSLLLLTATPLRGNAETFLGLLHLTDAEAYPLDDVDEFRRRLQLRHEQASSIELLSPHVPRPAARRVLNEFAAAYEGDERLQGLIRIAKDALDSESESASALTRVGDHMRETYRLSRRVIRHRRSSAAATGFPVSGRRCEVIEIADPARETIDEFLDQWRRCLRDGGGPVEALAAEFSSGVEAALAGGSTFSHFIRRRLDAKTSRNETERALLQQTKAILARRRNARFEALVGYLKATSARTKTVVFTGFAATALEARDLLDRAMRFGDAALHLASMTSAEQDEAVRRFQQDSRCRVLLCDPSGEEGRNLQSAGQVIHLDIPLSVNRLEQRIGRADRFNETAPSGGVPSIIFAERGSPWTEGHLKLLTEGIGIFDQSVATLQRPLADFELELTEQLFADGLGAFDQDVASLRERLDDERNQIDLLEELEATLTGREFSAAEIGDLAAFERDWGLTARAFDRLTANAGGIRLTSSANPSSGSTFSYSVDRALGTVPLMPADKQEQLTPLLSGTRTFNRTAALRSADVQIVRLGDPLVDWIEQYLRVDEGGRARAVWRHVPGWQGPEAWFCFDFLVEFDDQALDEFDSATRRRLRRRGDAFLPPRLERVWTDGTREAPDDLVESVLEKPSDAVRGATALRGPGWATALGLFPAWTASCHQAERRARGIVETRQEVIEWRDTAAAAAAEESAWRLQVLGLWTDRLPPGHQKDRARQEFALEQSIQNEVVSGVNRPSWSLYTVGGVIVAGMALEH